MVNQKTINGVIAVGVLAIAAVVVGGAVFDVGPLSAAGGGDDGSNYNFETGQITVTAKDAQASSETYTSSTYYVMNQNGVQVSSGTLPGDGSGATVSNLNPGQEYEVHVIDDDGSGSDYYHASTTQKIENPSNPVVLEQYEEGTASLAVKDDEGTENDGTISMAADEQQTVTVKLEQTASDATFMNPVVGYKTNDSVAIEKVELVDDDGNAVASFSGETDRLNTYSNFYETGLGQFTSDSNLNVRITSDNNDDPSNSEVSLVAADNAMFRTASGGFDSGVQDNNDNDIFAGDATATITVN